ncbi:MAG: chemotaxis protein CheD [bacterium]|nr:chemotaxis protein CheD [bacterium]
MVRVGMADMNICTAPDAITTLGLGSCVGIVLYDPARKLAGMVHVMLPDSTKIIHNENKAKFADTGIKELLEQLLHLGASRSRITAKIAGGAQMFGFQNASDLLRVGEKNVEATKMQLKALNIPIIAEDTGANYGRTIEFYPETGELLVKSVGKEIKRI